MTLDQILQLEGNKEYIPALYAYRKAYADNPEDYFLWRHYYFMLWYLLAEDFPLGLQDFVTQEKIDAELKRVGLAGIEQYKDSPDALFVLGYTTSIFPYYFGDYNEWENRAKQFLKSAHLIKHTDNIFKLAYLGSISGFKSEYDKVCRLAAPEVKLRFSGNGLLNSYFRNALYRIDKP